MTKPFRSAGNSPDRGRLLGRLIAPEAMREPDRSLGVVGVARPGRVEIGDRSGDSPSSPGRSWPACPSIVTCTGAGLRAKTSMRLSAGVQGQVDEDVDPVVANALGHAADRSGRRSRASSRPAP